MNDYSNWSPGRRATLLDCLHALADVEHQRDVWLGRRPQPGIEESFDTVIHFFFDDTELARNSGEEIGICLKSSSEADAVTTVTRALDALLEKHGLALTDAQYIATADWPQIVVVAQRALSQMQT